MYTNAIAIKKIEELLSRKQLILEQDLNQVIPPDSNDTSARTKRLNTLCAQLLNSLKAYLKLSPSKEELEYFLISEIAKLRPSSFYKEEFQLLIFTYDEVLFFGLGNHSIRNFWNSKKDELRFINSPEMGSDTYIKEKFIELAYLNVNRIHEKLNESIHRSEFLNDVTGTIESNRVIEFLTQHDLIETELDDDVYYLTPYAYDILECGDMKWVISQCYFKTYEANEEEAKVETEYENSTYDYEDLFPHEDKKHTFIGVKIIGALGIVLLSIFFSLKDKNELPLPFLKNKEFEYKIHKALDSLKKNKTSVPLKN